MAAKSGKILNQISDIFRYCLWRKTSVNTIFNRKVTSSSNFARNALKEKRLNDEGLKSFGENSTAPLQTFVNRNPKNPEYFGYNKQRGYSTQYKKRNFFKRLNLELSNRHVKAYVEDQDGNILVKASTEEFDVREHLYKANDVTAATNVGRVIADRCIRAGLDRVSMYTSDLRRKEKYREFRKAVTTGGVQLTEPARVIPPQTFYTGNSVKRKRKGIIGMKINNSTKRKFT